MGSWTWTHARGAHPDAGVIGVNSLADAAVLVLTGQASASRYVRAAAWGAAEYFPLTRCQQAAIRFPVTDPRAVHPARLKHGPGIVPSRHRPKLPPIHVSKPSSEPQLQEVRFFHHTWY